jgi:glycosyltransferase involved in cell wall biosynthesis
MVIFVDVRLLAAGGRSGVEAYTIGLLNALFREMPDDRFVLFYNGFRKAQLPDAWRSQPNVQILERRIPNRLYDLSSLLFRYPRSGSFVNADIVFSPHLNAMYASGGARRVMVIHDISFIHFPEFFPLGKRVWHFLQGFRGAAKRADAVVVDAEFTKADIVRTLGVPRARVHAIYPGIDPFFRVEDSGQTGIGEFRARHGLAGPYILTASVLEPRKNVAAIVRAFSVLKTDPAHSGVKLVIVGSRGWLYDTIFKEVERSPFREDIVLWGPATQEEMRALMNGATVFAYPSFFEGFGFPPLEAQSCGAPVIASDRSSLPEVLGASALLVNPNRTDDLIAALRAVLAEPALRERLRERGFENVRRFAWSKTARQFHKLFSELAARSNE